MKYQIEIEIEADSLIDAWKGLPLAVPVDLTPEKVSDAMAVGGLRKFSLRGNGRELTLNIAEGDSPRVKTIEYLSRESERSDHTSTWREGTFVV